MDNFVCVCVPAEDLLVRRPCNKQVLLVAVGVELNTVRHVPVGVVPKTFARLCVPQPDELVVAAADKPRAVVVERNVSHTLRTAQAVR